MRKAAMIAVAALFCGSAAGAAGKAGSSQVRTADKAWYDFIFEDGEPAAPSPAPQEVYSGPAKLVPISGHFDVTSESVMALKLVSGTGDKLVSSLSAMGFGVTTHSDFHGGYFLMVNVGTTDPVEAALTFLEYPGLSEVWVKRSLYEAVRSVR